MELVLEHLEKTRSNTEFLSSMNVPQSDEPIAVKSSKVRSKNMSKAKL
jgi:hypothetical protein